MNFEQLILAAVGVLFIFLFLASQYLPVKRSKKWIVAPLSFLLAIIGVAASYFFSLFSGLLFLVILTGVVGCLFINSLRIQEEVPADSFFYETFLQAEKSRETGAEAFDTLTRSENAVLPAEFPRPVSNLLEDDYIPELAYVSAKEGDFEELLKKTNPVKGRSWIWISQLK